MKRLLLWALALALVGFVPAPAAVAAPPRWTTTVFAKVPAPGYPA